MVLIPNGCPEETAVPTGDTGSGVDMDGSGNVGRGLDHGTHAIERIDRRQRTVVRR